VGVVLRLVLFALTPTFYGVENTLLYIPNDVFAAGFDGWPTLICPVVSLAVFVAVALLVPHRERQAAEPAPAAAR
jgi:solute:Na+ symporter, SSS family